MTLHLWWQTTQLWVCKSIGTNSLTVNDTSCLVAYPMLAITSWDQWPTYLTKFLYSFFCDAFPGFYNSLFQLLLFFKFLSSVSSSVAEMHAQVGYGLLSFSWWSLLLSLSCCMMNPLPIRNAWLDAFLCECLQTECFCTFLNSFCCYYHELHHQ